VGYLLAEPSVVQALKDVQPLWSVSTPALAALDVCLGRGPVKQAEREAEEIAQLRDALTTQLTALGVEVTPGSQAPFLLCRAPGRSDVRELLRQHGIAVRRGETFPGLTAEHWRIAIRDANACERLIEVLSFAL
jgi:histidinol-phosphate aminotransferase